MPTRPLRFAALAVLPLLLTAPAAAHRQWLLPSTTILSSTSQMVTVDAASSTNPFFADHNAMPTDAIEVWAPDGSKGAIQNAAKGRYRSTFDVAIDKPGTWRIGTATTNVMGRFKLNGEDWAVGRRRGPGMGPGMGGAGMAPGGPAMGAGAPPMAPGGGGEGRTIDPAHVVASVADIPAGATDLDLTESITSNQVFVTAGEPSDGVFKPTGKGLEMVPVTHPDALVSDEPGKFRFLIDGKPAPGLKVAVIPGGQRFRAAEQAQELTTGADGIVTVAWPLAGFYWLNATATDDKPSEAKATKRRLSYIVTLEVLAP